MRHDLDTIEPYTTGTSFIYYTQIMHQQINSRIISTTIGMTTIIRIREFYF